MSIIEKYGADTARLFMLSDSPPERDLDWSESGVDGCWKYLKKIWSHFQNYEIPIQNFDLLKEANEEGNKLRRDIHLCIKNTTDSIESFRYNSAVASIRKLSNLLPTGQLRNHHVMVFNVAKRKNCHEYHKLRKDRHKTKKYEGISFGTKNGPP